MKFSVLALASVAIILGSIIPALAQTTTMTTTITTSDDVASSILRELLAHTKVKAGSSGKLHETILGKGDDGYCETHDCGLIG